MEHLLNLGCSSRDLVSMREGNVIAIDGIRAAKHAHSLGDVAEFRVLWHGRQLCRVGEVLKPPAWTLHAQERESIAASGRV